uniref:Uncharacterized protein n=1 Tax=Timema poppense TaxID=170557 RepID=A0A7R9CRS9_TIMPO|nr:unnamed protein product [Timema poppensis]
MNALFVCNPGFPGGGREGEGHCVTSQPTKVSFRANQNKRITETVDGVGYRTGLAEKSYVWKYQFSRTIVITYIHSFINRPLRRPYGPRTTLALVETANDVEIEISLSSKHTSLAQNIKESEITFEEPKSFKEHILKNRCPSTPTPNLSPESPTRRDRSIPVQDEEGSILEVIKIRALVITDKSNVDVYVFTTF